MNTPRLFSVRDEWFADQASTLATRVDAQFELLWIVGAGFLLGAILLVALVLFRRREEPAKAALLAVQPAVLFGCAGALLAAFVFVGGWQVHVDAAVAPILFDRVEAVGSDAGWRFVYAPEVESPELHVRTENATLLTVRSDSGARTLRAPALRLVTTVVPDRSSEVWFEATQPGEFSLSGTGLRAAAPDSGVPRVVVHEPAAFEEWLASISNVLDRYPPVQAGQILVQRNGCLVCHTVDGSPLTGPSFLGVLGRARQFADGSRAVADSAYVLRSILTPQAQVVSGFETTLMPSFEGKLGEPEVGAILAWFESLVPADEQEGSR